MMTESGFGKEIMDRLPELEKIPGVWCASYFTGMPWVDCPQGGSTLVISGSGDKKAGVQAAKKMGKEIWDRRKSFVFQGTAMSPEEALVFLDKCGTYPAVLSDSADNVTAGASGDNGYLLKLIQEKGIKGILYAGFIDKPAVEQMAKMGPGERCTITLGKTVDPKSVPVTFENASVKEIFNKEKTPVAAVLKTNFHIMALTPGNCAQDLTLLDYKKIRRPMEPLEPVTDETRILETYGDE